MKKVKTEKLDDKDLQSRHSSVGLHGMSNEGNIAMKKNGANKMIEELGLEDCFIDAEEDFNIVPSDLDNLDDKIEEAIMENESNYNQGLVMIKSLGRLRK